MDDEEVREALVKLRRAATAMLKQIDHLDDKLSGKVAEQTALMSVEESVTPQAVLAGRFDGATLKVQRSRAISKALLVLWCVEWGKDHRRVKLTDDRHRAYLGALDDGFSPSEFARAIIGMRADPWRDRPKHNGWKLVRRGMQKFLALHDEIESGATNKVDMSGLGQTKLIHGVVVPSSYAWDHHDEFNVDIGNRFDPRECKWHAPESPLFGELASFNNVQE